MGLIDKILNKKDTTVKSYEDFWRWFQENEKGFFDVVKNEQDIYNNFLDKLSEKLHGIREGFYFLTGMADKRTAELIFSAEGEIKNIVNIEELVNAAPKIDGWIFTALKPELGIENVNISKDGYKFNSENLNFYSKEDRNFPDEINLTIVHNDCNEVNNETITTGIFLFLDNFLGELNAVTIIDSVEVIGKNDAKKELVPIEKLKDFLIWRQKEFIEKYEGERHDTENDMYNGLEAQTENGDPIVALMNSDLLKWERKASHPWIVIAELKYDGTNNNGMPDEKTYKLYNEIEEEILAELKDYEGYLFVGRETGLNVRKMYFACKDFRKPSKILQESNKKYALDFEIFKDKYWRCLSHFEGN